MLCSMTIEKNVYLKLLVLSRGSVNERVRKIDGFDLCLGMLFYKLIELKLKIIDSPGI